MRLSPPPCPAGGKGRERAGGRYRLVHKAAATRELRTTGTAAETAAILPKGSAVLVHEISETGDGHPRARTDFGWVSMISKGGRTLLEPQEPPAPASALRPQPGRLLCETARMRLAALVPPGPFRKAGLQRVLAAHLRAAARAAQPQPMLLLPALILALVVALPLWYRGRLHLPLWRILHVIHVLRHPRLALLGRRREHLRLDLLADARREEHEVGLRALGLGVAFRGGSHGNTISRSSFTQLSASAVEIGTRRGSAGMRGAADATTPCSRRAAAEACIWPSTRRSQRKPRRTRAV